MAVRLAHRLETSRVLDFVELSRQLNISKMEIPEKIVGKTVLAVNLRGRFGINIIAVETGGSLIETVNPDYVFKRGDILFISGNKVADEQLHRVGGETIRPCARGFSQSPALFLQYSLVYNHINKKSESAFHLRVLQCGRYGIKGVNQKP